MEGGSDGQEALGSYQHSRCLLQNQRDTPLLPPSKLGPVGKFNLHLSHFPRGAQWHFLAWIAFPRERKTDTLPNLGGAGGGEAAGASMVGGALPGMCKSGWLQCSVPTAAPVF